MQAYCKSRSAILASMALAAIGLCHTDVSWGAQVVAYPFPEGLVNDPDYRVQVNGKEVFVYNGPVAGLASFDFDGAVDVVITSRRDPKWVDVRPLSRKVAHTKKDNEIRFSLTKPGNFSIELNGQPKRHPLFLFANPIEKDTPTPQTPGVHYFAAGKVHRPGLIEVKSGETVYVAGGAIVEGSIVGKGVENVRLRGRGILDGTNLKELLRDKKLRANIIHLRDCKNVDVEGLVLSNGQTWQFVPVNCENLNITNVKIVSDAASDDGIDIVRSRNVKISKSFFHTKDDNIAIKAVFDYPKDVTTKDVEIFDSVFWNAAWGNALEIGFELQSELISNISFHDCDVIHVDDGAVFSIHNGDAATVSNVTFKNIRVEDSTQKLFDLAVFLSQYSVDRPEGKGEREARYLHGAWDGVLTVPAADIEKHKGYRGKIRDVLIENVQVVGGNFPFSIFWGFDPEHDIRGVVIKRLSVHGKPVRDAREARFVIQNAGVRFAN